MDMRSRSVIAALAFISALTMSDAALAHAELRSVSPAGHAVVASASTIQVRYGEPVGITADGITVTGANAKRWPVGPVTVDGGDISASLPALPAGTYVVNWASQAEDGHVQRRASTFAMGAPTRVLLPGEAAVSSRPTPTTVPRKASKTPSKAVSRKAVTTSTAVTVPATAELTLRSTDPSAPITSAVIRLRKLSDGRLGAVVQLPAGAAVPDSWALTASSTLSGGDPVAIVLTPKATAADAEAILLPPARWTFRLALDTGFAQSVVVADVTLSPGT